MVKQFPGSHNVFVPDHEASGRLTVNFSRNVKDFSLNKYIQIQPVKKVAGLWREVTVEEAGRILNSDGADFAWADGAMAPPDFDGTESFDWQQYRCNRYKFGATLGDLAIDQADFQLVDEHAAIKAQQAMTFRTNKVVAALTNASNYPGNHTSAVASISGNTGNWAASTTARQDIRRSLNHAANEIVKDTLAAVDPADIILVMSPGCAKAISETQEIVDYIKGSPHAWASVKGELANQNKNAAYGLPPTLYGYDVVIERTVKVTSRKGASATARSYVLPDASPFMCSRPGGLVGKFGAPSFSTAVLFMFEEMTQETRNDAYNRRTQVRVVENYDVQVLAPVSGFLFTEAV